MPYLIPITHHISEINIDKGVFIFIHRASKIPPHIGLIVDGTLFEISANGPGYEQKGVDLLKTAQKRGVEVVFIELITPNIDTTDDTSLRQLTEVGGMVSVNEPELLITNLVKHYFKVSNTVSCLNPIKDFIQKTYQIDVSKANFIFELLPILYDKNFVKNTYQVNLTNKLINHSFLLKKYTKQDIENSIAAVNRKNNSEVKIS
ncbi:MAG: hypothetical protein HYU68_02005 [Bacteroidetes bacterium]|nr:hypothetical protein [Bacteroidota bacterium]